MLLLELFDDDKDRPFSHHGEMTQRLQQAALDVITPMMGTNVPFVTMNQIIAKLSAAHFGLVITPALVMEILDPDKVKAISKIDGDRIYLNQPNLKPHDVDKEDAEADQSHVSNMAADQINQELQNK